MTTEAEIKAAIEAIKDLKLGTTMGPLELDIPVLRLIAMAVLHAAEDVRAAQQRQGAS